MWGCAGVSLQYYYIILSYKPSSTASDFPTLTKINIDFDAETFEKRENSEM